MNNPTTQSNNLVPVTQASSPAPSQRPQSPLSNAQPAPISSNNLAIIAFVIAIISLLPFTFYIAIIGFILGLIAIKNSPPRRGLAIAAVVIAISSILLYGFIIILIILNGGTIKNSKSIKTPCYSTTVPEKFIIGDAKNANDCDLNAELWGEIRDGKIYITNVGSILGTIGVEATAQESSSKNFGNSIDEIKLNVEKNYLPRVGGTLIGPPDKISLDGQPAYLYRIQSAVQTTKTKVIIIVLGPKIYQTKLNTLTHTYTNPETGISATTNSGDGSTKYDKTQLFILNVVTPQDDGEEIIKHLVSSWRWQ